jgi:hypothetical protein
VALPKVNFNGASDFKELGCVEDVLNENPAISVANAHATWYGVTEVAAAR